MSLLIVVSMSFSLSSVSMMVIQPLSLGFMLMVMVLFISVLIGIIIFSWYGYLLFLVFIGGMLVMFMYVISLMPNFIFLSGKVVLYFFSIFFGFMLMNFFVFKEMISGDMKSSMMFNYMNMSMGGSSVIMMSDNFFCYLLLGFILLFVLISVVKICYYCEGPLRVFKFK
uniref:NADH dehydrogenase subunit 6 n=1 Tax=Heteroteuthis dagamensis TaxID=1842503 RepID=A0A8F5CE59_9MOLL|nr:NADH dehydrogenase subunit 6 [Heteroteuthis dagamensis]QXJ42016.1 NADH dehydrogenase subunit 6 [Heteroteuthis dagamensis]